MRQLTLSDVSQGGSPKIQSQKLSTYLFVLLVFLTIIFIAGQAQTKKNTSVLAREQIATTNVQTYVLRLHPGQDLREQLELFTKEQKLTSGYIVTAVGSLQKAALRLANKSESTVWEDKFEIVSLVGTLAQDAPHLHIAISDGTGKTIGGHLVKGCEIYTTAEIVIGVLPTVRFTRERDVQTGYAELKFRPASVKRAKKLGDTK